jgi:hypothetical protein
VGGMMREAGQNLTRSVDSSPPLARTRPVLARNGGSPSLRGKLLGSDKNRRWLIMTQRGANQEITPLVAFQIKGSH